MVNGFVAFAVKTITILSPKKSVFDALAKAASVVFVETDHLVMFVPKFYVKIEPTICVLTILSGLCVSNVNEKLFWRNDICDCNSTMFFVCVLSFYLP